MADKEETIGRRIRRLRRRHGISQRNLAGPGVSYAFISRIEAGKRTPSVRAMRYLARKLGVTPHYIETGERVSEEEARELRLADAELELRMDRDLAKAERVFLPEATPSDDPRSDRDALFAARAHAGLGLIAARRSQSRETIAHLELAIGSGYLPPEARPDVYETLGAAYTAHGEAERAIALFGRCLDELRERAPEDAALAVRFLTYMALAHSSLGELTKMRQALHTATKRAEDAAPQARISLLWTLAISAWQNGESSERAREYISRAIGLLESTEDALQLARAHVFAAQMLTLDGEMIEADVHLAAADRLLGLGASDTDIGLLRAEQAKVSAARGDGARARAFAADAARRLGDDERYQGKKFHALGAANAALGDVDGAVANYQAALETLERRKQWREASRVAHEFGRYLRSLGGRDSEAFELMDRATVLATRQPGFAAQR